MDSLKNLAYNTGRNAYNTGAHFVDNARNTGEFINYGLSQTEGAIRSGGQAIVSGGKALANGGKKLLNSLPSMKSPSQRALPNEDFENGDRWGSRIKDSFQSSKPAKAPKQHASNLLPGQDNSYGGRFDFTA